MIKKSEIQVLYYSRFSEFCLLLKWRKRRNLTIFWLGSILQLRVQTTEKENLTPCYTEINIKVSCNNFSTSWSPNAMAVGWTFPAARSPVTSARTMNARREASNTGDKLTIPRHQNTYVRRWFCQFNLFKKNIFIRTRIKLRLFSQMRERRQNVPEIRRM